MPKEKSSKVKSGSEKSKSSGKKFTAGVSSFKSKDSSKKSSKAAPGSALQSKSPTKNSIKKMTGATLKKQPTTGKPSPKKSSKKAKSAKTKSANEAEQVQKDSSSSGPVPNDASQAEATEVEPSNTEQAIECEQNTEPKASAVVQQSEENQVEVENEQGTADKNKTEEEEPQSKLEFTKPTINQMKKQNKRDKPLSMSEKITNREFESLNDEVTDLNSGVQMLKHSYGSIVKSLVALQNRRSKKKEKAQAVGNNSERPVNFLTTMSTANPNELKTSSCLAQTDKYDIERFLNPITREETFNALFAEVQELENGLEGLRSKFYDSKGRFLREKYDSQSEVKLDRTNFNEYKLWAKKLAEVVDDIARNYNDDLLNMFRLA